MRSTAQMQDSVLVDLKDCKTSKQTHRHIHGKEGIEVVLSTIATKMWKLNSIDVKTAFRQGK